MSGYNGVTVGYSDELYRELQNCCVKHDLPMSDVARGGTILMLSFFIMVSLLISSVRSPPVALSRLAVRVSASERNWS